MKPEGQTPTTGRLTEAEARKLITEINAGVTSVRGLLLTLYEGGGWEALGYASWRECVTAEFTFEERHAYKLLTAAQIERRVCPAGQSLPERHARELAVVPDEKQPEVYAEAARTAPDGGLTAAHIRATVERLEAGPNKWGERATASNMADYQEAARRLNAVTAATVLFKVWKSVPPRVLFKAIDEVRHARPEERGDLLRDSMREALGG